MPYSEYRADLMGHATLEPSGRIEAGSWQEFTLVYTAGRFGLDDTGSLKIAFRFATDFGPVQFDDPGGSGYTTVEASNGAVLDVRWEFKRNIRPWSRALYIGVLEHFLAEGDTITIRFGDRREGSRGVRVQTYCEKRFEFRVFTDAIATYDYVALPESPVIDVAPGEGVDWHAVLPSRVIAGEEFRLCIKANDKWGNPSDLVDAELRLMSSAAITGLPETVRFYPGARAVVVDGLRAETPGEITIEVHEAGDIHRCTSNPVTVVAADATTGQRFWGDLHGQSDETLGTNDARAYFEFARDCAFVDVCAHQGNDFQMTQPFWQELNALTAELNVPGRFVTFPGYEWSANTAVGGDRNVFYAEEGRPMYRSSHAQIPDLADEDTDAHDADALFSRLADEDCVVWCHCGGRYADIRRSHDGRKEHAVEVHSAWGTFEWLLHDAFADGHRVGIVCNSDGHKGRPGASYPGASFFGAYGGLTCFLAPQLTRPDILEAMRRRHHYGTTGCRTDVDVDLVLGDGSRIFLRDPAVFADAVAEPGSRAIMGDIVETQDAEVALTVTALGASPILELDLFDGPEMIERRTYGQREGSRRVRVSFEGAKYRGRSRNVRWDGVVKITGNTFEEARAYNNWNLDRGVREFSATEISYRAVTTGNDCGIDLLLSDGETGTITLATALGDVTCDLATLGAAPERTEFGGLGRAVVVERLPEAMENRRVTETFRVPRHRDRDTRLWCRLRHRDGHKAWTSPIYLLPDAD